MFKKFIPFATAENVYDIDINFLKLNGIKVVFTDIDNTLDSFRALEPTEKVRNSIENLKKEFKVVKPLFMLTIQKNCVIIEPNTKYLCYNIPCKEMIRCVNV